MYNLLINLVIFIIILIIQEKIRKTEHSKKKLIIIIVSLIVSSFLVLYCLNEFNNIISTSLFINITITTFIEIILEKNKIDNKITLKNIFLTFLFGLSIATTLELTIFNYRHYESLNYQEYKLDNLILDKNIKEKNGLYYVEEDGDYTIEFTNINKKINNIKIDFIHQHNSHEIFEFIISATDEANELYLELPSVTTIETIPRSQYHKLNLSGKSENIKLTTELFKDSKYKLNEITINAQVPMFISKIRIIIISILIVIFYIFKPSSHIYKIKLLEYKKIKNIFILIIIIQTIIIALYSYSNSYSFVYNSTHLNQYQLLTDAFIKGQLNLDLDVSEELKSLTNPYDTYMRLEKGYETNKEYYWDTAYYNGKYYTYFGVVPVIFTYLPFNLITGRDLSNNTISFCIGILSIISILYLIYSVIKRWFPNTSLGLFCILSILFINSIGINHTIRCHDIYNIPIIFSLFFVTLGLGLWISSYNSKENNHNTLKLSLGSFCMALVAGCRPQFLIASFFIFPLFFKYFFKSGKLTKRKVKELIAILLPYIIVAIPLMLYNYYRFESIFDFGANYNLTTNDMTKRGFSLDRTFTGLYYYLLETPNMIPIFPFFEFIELKTNYLGRTIYEPMLSGFLATNIICILSLFTIKLKNIFEDKKLYYISLLSVIFAIIIIIVDTNMAGILTRYIYDFSWLFYLSTILIILSLNKKYNRNKYFLIIVTTIVAVCILNNITFTLLDFSYSIAEYNLVVFENLKYLICFWL